MFNLQWFRARGIHRGKPGLPGGHGRRLAVLGILIATSLLETGCQSGPFSPCGCVGRTTNRLMSTFRRDRAACGEVVSDGGCISSGVPVETVVPAPVIVPGATVVPGAVLTVIGYSHKSRTVPFGEPGARPLSADPPPFRGGDHQGDEL